MSLFFKQNRSKKNPFTIQEGRFKNGKLEGFSYLNAWKEDSFSLESNQNEMIGKNFDVNSISLKIVVFFILLFIFVLVGRVAWLQVVKGDYYYSLAEGNRVRIQRIEAKRGVVYDRNFNPLVRNVANFLLYFIPADFPRDEEKKNLLDEDKKNLIIEEISKILDGKDNKDKDSIKKEINEKLEKISINSLEAYQPLFITDNIEHEKAMLLYLASDRMPGVVLSNKTKREYNLYSLSLSHILGYTGKISEEELKKAGDEYLQIDYIGKTGVEYFWENEMKGKNGKKNIEVDALGKEKKVINIEEAEDGHNLVLSLNIELQKKLEETIIKTLEKLKLNKAAAIIMDPNNGEILASVSFPSYNNNAFARGISQEEYSSLINHPDNPLFNRCISGEYPSGSTIKPVISVAALQEKIISEKTSFNSVGGIRIGEWFFPDWKVGGHGITDVKKAISQSVNTFFYYIGGGYDDFTGLGIEKMTKYFSLFGLGSQTGVDLYGEADGFLPTKEWKEEIKKENWYIGDTYHVSIGQGDLLVTPLQVANFTSVFANEGKLYRPHFIKQILTGNDKKIGDIESVPIRENFIDNYNLEVVRQGMRQTVLSGSARSLNSVPVSVAGKTGTAQWSTKKNYHAWFTGFAPYDNPEIVITVLVEEGGEGSDTAVPIVKEVLEWYFEH